MIARLRGTVETISKESIIVMVGGVGFRVIASAAARQALDGLGSRVDLFTHLHVRENELTLYGFASEQEAELFELLLSVSGVGPKAALAVLAAAPPQTLRAAIANEQTDVLRVPGVGPKTARAIILHLKDKVGAGLPLVSGQVYLTDADAEVIAALTSLGYSLVEAHTALAGIPRDKSVPLEERIRQALAYFAKP